jgi:hypothetical protein
MASLVMLPADDFSEQPETLTEPMSDRERLFLIDAVGWLLHDAWVDQKANRRERKERRLCRSRRQRD